jgi:5-formyltetrahydrofolate cyclo-ligase
VRSDELKRAKREVRRRIIAARDAMSPEERAAFAERVADRFLALPEVAAARTVMAFWSFGSELSMEPLIERLDTAGISIGLPRIDGDALEVRRYRPGDRTTETSFGAREPVDGAPIDPGAIDVIATPGVAFDRRGRRVGYGGGFYDRFLPLTRADAFRVGVAAPLQVVDEDLPSGGFDLRVHAIVTPDETFRCSSA